MKKILLLFLLLWSFCVSAQDQTSAPIVLHRYYPDWTPVTEVRFYEWGAIAFQNMDAQDVTIYYRYQCYDEWYGREVSSDWKSTHLLGNMTWSDIVDPDLLFTTSAYGWVEAYSVAEDKSPSETVRYEFMINCYPWSQYQRYYDFIVDGVYYSILNDTEVAVSKLTIDETVEVDPYNGSVTRPGEGDGLFDPWNTANPCYEGDLIIPATVDYGGKTYTVTGIKDFAFEACGLTSLQLPNTVKTIGTCAFYGSSIPEITIPNSVISIDLGTFSHCFELTSVRIPEGVDTIGCGAFSWCESLTDIVIPNTVKTIGTSAFSNCYQLTGVTIPESVVEIGGSAFFNCIGLASVTCQSMVPPEADDAFASEEGYFSSWFIYDNAALFVPAEAIEDYRAHEEWGRFARIVPFIGAGPGDVDGSGGIDVDDVTGIIGMILEGQVPAYADVNGDGATDIDDITVLINMLLGGHW